MAFCNSYALGHTTSERLAYHQQHSHPVMAEIKQWGQQHLDTGNMEAISSFGKAVHYFIKHFDGLSAFCTVEGARIDNNQL